MHQPSENRCAHKLISSGGWEVKGLHSWSCSSRRPKDLSCRHILSFLPEGPRVYFWELWGLLALCSFVFSGKPQLQPPPSTFSQGSAQPPAPIGACLVHSFYIVALNTYIPGSSQRGAFLGSRAFKVVLEEWMTQQTFTINPLTRNYLSLKGDQGQILLQRK